LKNGVHEFHKRLRTLDSGFYRNDGKRAFSTFYEFVNFEYPKNIRIMAVMEKQQDTQNDFREKRASPRTFVERYYSVQFAINKEIPAYQFKLRDISDGGLCIAIRQDSAILDHIKVGEIVKTQNWDGKVKSFRCKARKF